MSDGPSGRNEAFIHFPITYSLSKTILKLLVVMTIVTELHHGCDGRATIYVVPMNHHINIKEGCEYLVRPYPLGWFHRDCEFDLKWQIDPSLVDKRYNAVLHCLFILSELASNFKDPEWSATERDKLAGRFDTL